MRPGNTSKTFLLDANVLVAAIRHLPRRTPTYDLVVGLASDETVLLVSNPILEQEYLRNVARFPSPEAADLVDMVRRRCQLLEVSKESLLRMKPLVSTPQRADAVHAAAALDAGAVLISNDRDFDAIARSGLVEVWSIGRAVLELL